MVVVLIQLNPFISPLLPLLQIRKALELHEQLRQRMGVVIVGPSGSGKSVVWLLLRTALNRRGQMVKDYTMNPKAMPRTQVGPTLVQVPTSHIKNISQNVRQCRDGKP